MEVDKSTDSVKPKEMLRVAPKIVFDRVNHGDALLVCAYKSDVMYWAAELQGSIPLKEFEAMLPNLPLDQEIYFYCA